MQATFYPYTAWKTRIFTDKGKWDRSAAADRLGFIGEVDVFA
jgi:hypothetical protein